MGCRFKAACSPRRFPNVRAAKCASRTAWQDCVADTIDRAPARAKRARMRQVEGAGGRRAGANGILTPRTRRGGRARFKAHAWRACKLGRVSGVQIPPSPPTSPYILPTFWRRQKLHGIWRSFYPQRTGESHLTPNSPDSASILSVQNKNGSLSAPECALGGCSPTIAMRISLEWFRDSAVLADVRAPRQAVGVVPSIHRRLSRQCK